jgi:hypothetical protein
MPLDALPQRRADLSVEATLLFVEPGDAKPVVSFTYESGDSVTNATYAPRIVPIRDARAIQASLDVEGFELVRHVTAATDLRQEAQALDIGRAEAAELVARATGAARVHVFDHTLRRAAPNAPRQPSTRVHNDYTPASAAQRMRDVLREEAEALLRRPFAFINVWRPVGHPAATWPLALCDARSLDEADLVATDIVFPDRRGEIYGARLSPGQRWFYYPEMRPDEVLLIKCYDTRPGVARFMPHTAFENPLAPAGAPPRESIEFRTVAFFS